MELASGGELFNIVSLTGAFDDDLCRHYFQKLVTAVDYCHQMGVTHRDLKLENIMLDENFELKLIDFGLAVSIFGRDGSGNLTT